ncbi:MAG: hypothetical protein K9K32_06725 [Halanaerobiales bacterium]|nr:hypothetical protein [Halanaerobiales bacterium]
MNVRKGDNMIAILIILFCLLMICAGGFLIAACIISFQKNKAKELYNQGKINLEAYRLIKNEIIKEDGINE